MKKIIIKDRQQLIINDGPYFCNLLNEDGNLTKPNLSPGLQISERLREIKSVVFASHNRYFPKKLGVFLGKIPQLKCLDLSGMQDIHFQKLYAGIGQLRNLEELYLSDNSFYVAHLDLGFMLSNCTKLKILDLSFSGLRNDGLKALAKNLKGLLSLMVLDIRGILLYEDGKKALTEALMNNNNLLWFESLSKIPELTKKVLYNQETFKAAIEKTFCLYKETHNNYKLLNLNESDEIKHINFIKPHISNFISGKDIFMILSHKKFIGWGLKELGYDSNESKNYESYIIGYANKNYLQLKGVYNEVLNYDHEPSFETNNTDSPLNDEQIEDNICEVNISSLPTEILAKIFSYLDMEEELKPSFSKSLETIHSEDYEICEIGRAFESCGELISK